MFERLLQGLIERRLRHSPAVALLGPRQVGKTTLARAIAERHPGALLHARAMSGWCFRNRAAMRVYRSVKMIV